MSARRRADGRSTIGPVPPSVLAVVAAYGLTALTRAIAADLAREPHATVLIVDNGGDYEATGGETVERPGRNLGWLGACNLGLERAAAGGYEHVLLLNNDTQLSDGFVAGLQAAHAAVGGMIAPVYDDTAVAVQHHPTGGPAAAYLPRDAERRVSVVDGTAVLASVADADRLEPLDARRFGRHGWGAMEDWCLTASLRGVGIHVTERAYCSHARGSTADAVNTRYTHFASAEMHYGLVRKWGRRWSTDLPGSGHAPLSWPALAQIAGWHWLEASGLARRLQRPPADD